jgi:predicted RNA-binding Zn ribbon-like protein
MLEEQELERVVRRFDATALDQAAAACRDLREWLRTTLAHGDAFTPLQDQGPLAAVMAEDWSRPMLGADGWTRWREFRSPLSILGPVAEMVEDLLINADRARVRQCEGENCSLWFLDVSKSNRRRWCSMEVCGNRSKVAAHRARSRARYSVRSARPPASARL